MVIMHAGTSQWTGVLVQGELQVSLIQARSLPVWGFPWTSNPWCRLTLGTQVCRPAVHMLQQQTMWVHVRQPWWLMIYTCARLGIAASCCLAG